MGHQGPLRQGDPHYAGSRYNVQIEWEGCVSVDDTVGERTDGWAFMSSSCFNLPWAYYLEVGMRIVHLLQCGLPCAAGVQAHDDALQAG